MATDTLRVGIIGAGANTRLKHIPGLRTQNSVEIVGVANRSEESSSKAAKELDIPKAYGDWTEIVADPNIDAVCIGTWPYTHAQMTIAALDAGKHVLCEARMAMNAREAHAMLAASRRNPSRIAQIVPAPMSLPVDRTICRHDCRRRARRHHRDRPARVHRRLSERRRAAALAAEPRSLRQQHHGARHLVRADDALGRSRGVGVRGRPGGREAPQGRRRRARADHDPRPHRRRRPPAARRPVSPRAVVGRRPRAAPDRSLDFRRQGHAGVRHAERGRALSAARQERRRDGGAGDRSRTSAAAGAWRKSSSTRCAAARR